MPAKVYAQRKNGAASKPYAESDAHVSTTDTGCNAHKKQPLVKIDHYITPSRNRSLNHKQRRGLTIGRQPMSSFSRTRQIEGESRCSQRN